MKQSVTVGAQLLWSGRYGCNNGRYGCTIVMSHIEINKAVSQWLLTFNLCVSVTWPLTCAFHIPCTHTPEIIDMHRGMCDKRPSQTCQTLILCIHDDVIKWKQFPSYWPFSQGIHRSPVNSRTNASDAKLWYFLGSAPDPTVEQTVETPVISDAIALIMTSLWWIGGSQTHMVS